MDAVKRREDFKKKLRKVIEKPKTKETLLPKKEKENKIYRVLASKSKKKIIVLKENKNLLNSKKEQNYALTEEVKRTEEEIKILKILIPYISKRKEHLKYLQKRMDELLEKLKNCVEPVVLSDIMAEFLMIRGQLEELSLDDEIIRKNTHFDGFERYTISDLNDKISKYKAKNKEEVISKFAKECSKLASSLEKKTEVLEKWVSAEQKLKEKKKQFEQREENFKQEKENSNKKNETLTSFHHTLIEIGNMRYYNNQKLLKEERILRSETYSFLERMISKTTVASFAFALLSTGVNPLTLFLSISLLNGPFKTDKEDTIKFQRQKLLNLYDNYDKNISFELETLQTLGTVITKNEEEVKQMKEKFQTNYKDEINQIPEFREFFRSLESLELQFYQKKLEQQKELETMQKEKKNAKEKKLILKKES